MSKINKFSSGFSELNYVRKNTRIFRFLLLPTCPAGSRDISW
ncbi:MAG: hypothetical protein ACYST3_09615 [Planctomycetota bacterium]